MAFTLADRVRETSTTEGTGTYTLLGAVSGFRTFLSTIGNGNTCSYVVAMGSQWEVVIGTVSTSGPTLSRTTILASSNAGSAVNWTAGTKEVRCDMPASKLLDLVRWSGAATAVAASGASVSITNIPADTRRVTILFDLVSTTGTDDLILQLGDAGGYEVSGYNGNVARFTATPTITFSTHSGGFVLDNGVLATGSTYGRVTLSLADASTNNWVIDGTLKGGGPSFLLVGGSKALSSALTQIQVAPDTSNTFDAGTITFVVET